MFCVISLLCINVAPIKASGNLYCVYDSSNNINEKFSDYYDALSFYEDNIDEADNLLLSKNDKLIKMEYGIVSFNTNKACDINVEYRSKSKGTFDYLNGCYGNDAAYLNSDDYGVYFKISDDIGYANIDDVTLIPYERINYGVSSYQIRENGLFHNIKANANYAYYSYSINLGDKPKYLENNKEYFSYDGHYFYDNFLAMLSDYHDGTYENAINKEPYYNYYQYLPYRSMSNITSVELEDYLTNTLGITAKLDSYNDLSNDGANDDVNRSQLYGEVDNFFVNESIYGTNSLMLLANAIVDSNYGKSASSYYNNSLYTNMAFDSDSQRENNHYDSISNSIYSFAKYFISNIYGDYRRITYHGTNFGSKLGGMNVEYSLDPYYGEKCASNYYTIDKALGFKDKDSYALAIVNDKDVSFYKDEEASKFYYKVEDIAELSMIVLEECENTFKIQMDFSNSTDGTYDFEKCVAYIKKDDIDYLINKSNINEPTYSHGYYDFNGGTFNGKKGVKIQSKNGNQLNIVPIKEGYDFVKYDKDNIAQYKEIKNISLVGNIYPYLYQDAYLDISNASLKINYSSGGSKTIDITSDNISYYDNKYDDIVPIEIVYNGVSIDYDISVLDNSLYEEVKNASKDDNLQSALFVKENMNKTNYVLSMEEIIKNDRQIKNNNGYNYHVYDNNSDVSVSGMALSLDEPFISSIIYKDTYYLEVKNLSKKTLNKLSAYASAYGFEIEDSYNLNFELNYSDIKQNGPVVIKSKINQTNNKVYSVYYLEADGDIVKCQTGFSSDYVYFIANKEGDYMVLSLDWPNTFTTFDANQNVSYLNNDPDNHQIIREVFLFVVLMLLGLINIFVDYIIKNKRKNLWIDYRNSLRMLESAHAGKQKN